MRTNPLLYLLLVALLLFACSSKRRKENTLNISGAWALYPIAVKWAEEYKKEYPGVRFNISGGGAGKGLADALAGVVDLGMFSRNVTPEEKAKGTWWVGIAIDAVLPIINANNPHIKALQKRGITRQEFRGIFVEGTIKTWGDLLSLDDKKNIEVYTRSDACGAGEVWAKYMGSHQEDLKGIGVFGDPGLAEVIAKAPYGIGYNNLVYAYNLQTRFNNPGLVVVPIDINENGAIDPEELFYDTFDEVLGGISDGRYPSPPARELYFVSKGVPEKAIARHFLQWILTRGQDFVEEAGYIKLDQDVIDAYLKQLN